MKKLRLTTDGFTAVEFLLLIVTLAIIGLAGYFVAKHMDKKTTPIATATTSTTANKSAKSTTTTTNPAASWYLYTSPGNSYTMRIPDGWNLEQNGTSSNAELDSLLLYSDSGNTLAITQGTPGLVTPQPAVGRDAPPTLDVQWCPTADTTCPMSLGPGSTQQTSLKTSSGLTIEKYYFYEAQPSTDISEPPQGTQYTYLIKSSSSELWTSYYFAPGQTDYHTNVEEALETVILN